MELEGREGVWKRVCCANVLCVVFKAARLRVAAGWMEPWSCFRYALLPSREEVARDDPHFLPASLTTSLSNWVISNYKAIGQPTHTWMEQFAPEFISTDRPGKRVSAWNSLSFRALVNGNALRSPKAILSRKSVSFLLFVCIRISLFLSSIRVAIRTRFIRAFVQFRNGIVGN